MSLLRPSDSCCGTQCEQTLLRCRLQPAPKCNHPPCQCCSAPADCGQGHWLAVYHHLIITSPRSDPASAYALANGSNCRQYRRLSRGLCTAAAPPPLIGPSCVTRASLAVRQQWCWCLCSMVCAFSALPHRLQECRNSISSRTPASPRPPSHRPRPAPLPDHILSLLNCIALARHPSPLLFGSSSAGESRLAPQFFVKIPQCRPEIIKNVALVR